MDFPILCSHRRRRSDRGLRGAHASRVLAEGNTGILPNTVRLANLNDSECNSQRIALGVPRNAPASWSAAVLCRLGMARRYLKLLSWSPVCQVPGRRPPFLCYSFPAGTQPWAPVFAVRKRRRTWLVVGSKLCGVRGLVRHPKAAQDCRTPRRWRDRRSFTRLRNCWLSEQYWASRRRELPTIEPPFGLQTLRVAGASTPEVRRGGTPRPAPGTGALPGACRRSFPHSQRATFR